MGIFGRKMCNVYSAFRKRSMPRRGIRAVLGLEIVHIQVDLSRFGVYVP